MFAFVALLLSLASSRAATEFSGRPEPDLRGAASLGASLSDPAPATDEDGFEEWSDPAAATEDPPTPLQAFLERIELSYGIDMYRTGTYGNLTRSFKPSRTYSLHNMSAGYKDKFGDVTMDLQSSLRWTDDPTITRRRDYQLMSIYGNFERADKWGLRLGDISPNYSRYGFSRSARYGAHGWYDLDAWGGDLRVSLASGIVNRDQEFIGGTESGQYRRWGSGAAIDWKGDGPGPMGELKLGVRHSTVNDDGSSITNRRNSGGAPVPKMHIDVSSLVYDAALPLGLTLRGESAYSYGIRDYFAAASRILAGTQAFKRSGHAHNSALAWRRPSDWGEPTSWRRLLPISSRADAEWVSPFFLTELGSAAVDQLRWGHSSDYRWNDALDWSTSFTWNEDNVRRRGATLTSPTHVKNVNRTTGLRMNTRPFRLARLLESQEHLQSLKYGFEFRYSDRDANNATTNQKVEDYNHSLDYTNWGATWSADYKFQITDDDVRANNDRRIDDWGVRVNRPFTFSAWQIRLTPSASYRHSVDKTIRGENFTRTQTTNFGLGAAFGEFNINLAYAITDADRNQRAADSLSDQLTASLAFAPVAIPDLKMSVSYRHQDVDEENAPNSFRQNETKVHLEYRF